MSVIGVYLPCLDQGVDCFREHLQELERLISESRLLGPVILLGDFNAHIGGLECQHLQKVLLHGEMDRCELSAISQGAGLSVNNFYAGGFLHADNIRTLATSEASLRYQIDLVKAFAEQNLLKLNVGKCVIVVFSKQPSKALPVCEVDGLVMLAGDVGKCLGYWWKGDHSASRSVEENIWKARCAFFHFSSIGVFQGDISPLSSKEVIEACVMPVLLYGSDNWVLTDVLTERLDAFQAELVKRVLKWPKHHSNTATIVVLDVPAMKCRVLMRKLGFLRRVMAGDSDGLSGSVMLALCDDADSICLVRECRELEERFGTHFTNDILNKSACSFKQMKKAVMDADKKTRMERCKE